VAPVEPAAVGIPGVALVAAPIVAFDNMNGSLVDAPPPTHPTIVTVCGDVPVDCEPAGG
jgi:hypothetical protein